MGQAARKKKMLAPLIKLGVSKTDHIEKALTDAFGQERAKDITENWNRLSEADDAGRPGEQNALYEYLNSSFDLAMVVSNYTDAAIIRAFCQWIYEHKALFGTDILDAGCGIGIISCYLAWMLPDSRITAVDRSKNSISVARQVQEKLGVSNITFVQTSVKDLPEETFDTVLSTRTFHENIGVRYTGNRFLPFSQQISVYRDIYRNYTGLLTSLVRPQGRMVCMERNHFDTEYYALLRDVCEAGFSICPDSLSELRCAESDFKEPSVFECFAAEKSRVEDEKELFAVWKQKAFSPSDDPEYFTRAQTDAFVERMAGDLIEGYETFDDHGTQLARAGLYHHRENPDEFLMCQANYGQAGVQVLPMEALDEAREIFADHKKVDTSNGFLVRELTEQ